MVSIGSKALLLRRPRSSNLLGDRLMGGEEENKQRKVGKRNKGMRRKAQKESFGFDGKNSKKKSSELASDGEKMSSKSQKTLETRPSIIRKPVDPETSKYFSEIMNLFESGGVELDERMVICGNALEEARGKEFELATDYILSHTLESLLEGCDVDHLCSFLRGCKEVFSVIAMDRSGSHVVESALKSLTMHLQDSEAFGLIEETLEIICKEIVVNPIEMMCNRYGSHVLRSLLCLCGGVPLDAPEFHGVKPLSVLKERLNFGASPTDSRGSETIEHRFPSMLTFLVSEMVKGSEEGIENLLLDQYGSLVLQTALKLLVGHDNELMQIIPLLVGVQQENLNEGNDIKISAAGHIIELMKETAYSHLVEVILEVAPERLYDEIFIQVFRNSLFKLSCHQCGNFVIQALISRARTNEQMELMWEELGTKFKDLLEMGKSGVIASLIASSHRLQNHEHKCSQALVAAVCSPDEDKRCIVPRILFLDHYFNRNDRSNWNWPKGAKMHVMGSLILQATFRLRGEFIQDYITSITCLEGDHVLEVAKDAGGARVIEAFLGSNASAKQKRRLIMRLRGQFGELAMQSSGSFTVEKCFTISNLSLREAIVSDLLAVRAELSKTKHGPYLLRKLDVDFFESRPEQWRSKQASKQSTYKEFYAAFGSSGSQKTDSFVGSASKSKSHPNDVKRIREEIDQRLASNKHAKKASWKATGVEQPKPFLSVDMKKRHRKDRPSKSSNKKPKV